MSVEGRMKKNEGERKKQKEEVRKVTHVQYYNTHYTHSNTQQYMIYRVGEGMNASLFLSLSLSL